MSKKFAIHWFRRDLHIPGNEALRENWVKNERNVLGIFCFDADFLSRKDFSHNRFAFFLESLRDLQSQMRKLGGDLLIVDQQPHLAFAKLLDYFKTSGAGLPNAVSFSRDYEPFAIDRDKRVSEIIRSYGVQLISARDHLILEPSEVLKDDQSFYQVYSPFARKWFEKLAQPEIQKRISAQKTLETYCAKMKSESLESLFDIKWSEFKDLPYQDRLQQFTDENQKSVSIPIPKAGILAAYERLLQFRNSVDHYKDSRDTPSIDGTSQLSIFLKNGTLTSAQIFFTLGLQKQNFKMKEQATQYAKEIVWREFYYSILYHKPSVENSAFLRQYVDLKWSDNQQWFQKWCEGQTGFPIVDAGMRQLNSTGWMHNRVRMIVASFLVKDLLINWQWGEAYFMKMLLDGDMAPNNGGWQWAASTGCDPQPYFRIFNPWLQSEKFDPNASYIKKYVPELKACTPDAIHSPEASRGPTYPRPIVDHHAQKEKAIALFKAVLRPN